MILTDKHGFGSTPAQIAEAAARAVNDDGACGAREAFFAAAVAPPPTVLVFPLRSVPKWVLADS